MSRNVNTGLSLAMVAGALIVAADEAGARVVLAEPSTWKKQVLGHGGLGKSEIAEWLAREQPVLHAQCGANQDLVDACCIALFGQTLLA
jgi:Holliday junction resolvasome RuvABC endonuclease subunit